MHFSSAVFAMLAMPMSIRTPMHDKQATSSVPCQKWPVRRRPKTTVRYLSEASSWQQQSSLTRLPHVGLHDSKQLSKQNASEERALMCYRNRGCAGPTSSRKSNLGFFNAACAIASRCCSPLYYRHGFLWDEKSKLSIVTVQPLIL